MSRKIYAFIGPMFSGKTGALDNVLRTQQIANMNTILFRPAFDTRTKKHQDHDGFSRFTGPCHVVSEINEVWEICATEKPQVVGFDEGQFFKPELIHLIKRQYQHGVLVYYAGLDSDFLGQPFENTRDLIVVPEVKVYKQRAICVFCSGTATRTLKITHDDRIVTSLTNEKEAREEVGSEDKYRPACISCFFIAMDTGLLTVQDLQAKCKSTKVVQ